MAMAVLAAETGGRSPAVGSPPPPRPVSPSGPGRLRDAAVSDHDRNFAVAIHLSPLAGFVFGPAVIAPAVLWAIRKNVSPFNDDHGREVISFGLSMLLWHVALALTVVGLVLWPVLWIIIVVNLIRAAAAAGNGEYFRYPMTIRFL